jgi:hypothetical protein
MAMDGIKAVRIPQQTTPPSPTLHLFYLYVYAYLRAAHALECFITDILRY